MHYILKSEYIDLSLPFKNKKVSILIRGLILFTKVIKKQSIVTYQLIIVYAHVHLMTHLHRIYIVFFSFFIFFLLFMYVCLIIINHCVEDFLLDCLPFLGP